MWNIDLEIQKELQTITNMRIISKKIQNEYNQIIKNQIEPWIDNYFNSITNNNTQIQQLVDIV